MEVVESVSDDRPVIRATVDVADSSGTQVESPGHGLLELFHHCSEVEVGYCNQQVKVVGHQHECVHLGPEVETYCKELKIKAIPAFI
jgi:hypothetical protein